VRLRALDKLVFPSPIDPDSMKRSIHDSAARWAYAAVAPQSI